MLLPLPLLPPPPGPGCGDSAAAWIVNIVRAWRTGSLTGGSGRPCARGVASLAPGTGTCQASMLLPWPLDSSQALCGRHPGSALPPLLLSPAGTQAVVSQTRDCCDWVRPPCGLGSCRLHRWLAVSLIARRLSLELPASA